LYSLLLLLLLLLLLQQYVWLNHSHFLLLLLLVLRQLYGWLGSVLLLPAGCHEGEVIHKNYSCILIFTIV
jgi:hypothetical protein